ncbi:hypothetical protein [Actinokineospora enzanensis]|uniref:hypothetical protein n=1 Tax=Actinokineospora enzanensis TaxID=155975 RepID=UPI00039DD280|nr:hypothetical protein [Actinokineospora enzanensis]
MKLDGREWRMLVSSVRLGDERYRVIRPERPIPHASLYDGRLGAELAVDKDGALDIAFAWWLAARSPRSLVYLPLRSGKSTCGEEYGGRKLDLVLLHHTLQFRASRWKQVRSRLSPAAIHKMTLPPRPFRPFDLDAHVRPHQDDFRDHLRWSLAADTLFLIGSRQAYERQGDALRTLAEDCPTHLAENPETHCCAEIDLGRINVRPVDHRNPPSMLHVVRCHRHIR